nr:nesprin-2-like [Meriones unguiculatus]
MVELSTVLKNLTDESQELDLRLKVEEAEKELESYIARAEQLLEQRERPGGLVSKYKEALEIFNTNSLAKFLQAIGELRRNVPGDAKLLLEERRRDACAKWEPLHHGISLYIQQLKIDIEEGKLRDNIAKLEKQINKEKKLLRRGRTRGLTKEHEAFFSPESIASQLEQHVGVLRALCEELTSPEDRQELRRTLRDYEQKIERLLKCAAEIHVSLQSSRAGPPKERGALATTENGRRDAHDEAPRETPDNQLSTEKAMGPIKNLRQVSELKPQQEESIVEKEGKDGSASLNDLQERYDKQREILERRLQDSKTRATSDFPSESERSSSCLRGKRKELQVLQADTDACWDEFEVASLNLESLVSDSEKATLAQARDFLKGKEHELQVLLNARMESLEMALQILLPLEKECARLCASDLPFCTVALLDLCPVDIDGLYQNLQVNKFSQRIYKNDRRDSIAKQIRICANLKEPSDSVPRALHTLDQRAVGEIALTCRHQLELVNQKAEMREAALEALEGFLASLRAAKLAAELPADPPASNAPEHALAGRAIEEDLLQMREEAGPLDERLRTLGIILKDAEGRENTTCEGLLRALSGTSPAVRGRSKEEGLTEDRKFLEACSSKNHELFKNIQDIQNQIGKIGLKDPTAPAVKHRLEQCGSVLELLKQYQNFKNNLTALIQKEEGIISQQASYMGKDNLKKKIAEIETVKEEFSEHLEVVDKINQICKNLQYHLNKMKTFDEPPFEKEANAIVDRWLDINEKTEEYGENLGRALALWDKLFNLKTNIDEWTEKTLGKVESHELTEEDREKLKEELKVHEEQTSEFSRRVADIQLLLQSNEKPLELQVMESSVLSKMKNVQRRVTGESNSCVPSGNTAELREDLDQAKTRMGMTESLLNALSPSDSLEIFTKLEEIQQQIFQQKHCMTVLENQIGCLTPELSDLKRQYASVSDLFNTKKSALQDHFATFLNEQCKNFNDWFSSVKVNLQECFEPPETKPSMEQKLQKLSDFLTLGGGTSKIQPMETVLQHVEMLLPKAHVKELGSWLRSQGLELENMESVCQARARELRSSLQQLLREQFEAVAQLNDSLKELGLTEGDETIKESTHLIDRYQTLLRQLHEIEEEDKLPPAEDQSFNDLAQDEIILLKPEGDARIQMVTRQAEHCEAPLAQESLTDLRNQWDSTLHLANTYLSHQEKLVLEGEKYLQSKEDLRLMLTELKKQQEAGFALQPGLPEKQAQLKIYKKFLQKAQDLTSLLEELKSQGNYLLECTKNPSFREEPWLEIKLLHESLLQQLQDSVQKLEGHVQEHSSYQDCLADLNNTLGDISKEFLSLCDDSEDQITVEDRMQKLQALEGRLRLQGSTWKKASALAKSIKHNTSLVGQKMIKDDMKALKCKQKDLENRIEAAKHESEKSLNNILQSKGSTEKHAKFSLPGGEALAASSVPEPTQKSAAVGESPRRWETNAELLTLKKTAESQYGLLDGFQDQLAAAEASLNSFLMEVDSLKIGSLDSATYLGKIKKFLGSVEKENGSLSRLRTEWAHLSSHLTAEDQKLVESQMRHLEQGWELVEHLAHRKCFQQATEHSELACLLKKAQDIEASLHQQRQSLLLALNPPEQQEGGVDMLAPAAELQAIKHEFSGFKRQAELQMKRLWGEKDEKTLEDAIDNLSKQLEALEPLNREVENQVKKSGLRNRMKETLSWVKSMLAELTAPVALLPDDILSQIRKCKLIHDGILGKQQAVESLVEEVRGVTPSLAARERDGLKALLEGLRRQYQALLVKSTQRSQKLERKLEERSKLFSVIGKAQLTLGQSEALMFPTREGASTEAELERRRAALKASQQQLGDMESGISAHLYELTNAYKDANVFERLCLDDQLKNLKTRANRAQRFIQNSCGELEHGMESRREFCKRTAALQEELESIQHGERLPLHQGLEAKEELGRLRDRLAVVRGRISQVSTSEDVFGAVGLSWDGSLLEQLRTQVLERERELEEKTKQLDAFLKACDTYQASLSKMRALDLQIKERAASLLKAPSTSPESALLNAQILIQKIKKAKCLHDEIIKNLSKNEAFDNSFREREMLQLKLNAEENARLHEALQSMLLELQQKGMGGRASQDKLENSLRVLKQIKSRLQQPLCVNLGSQHIQDEKETLETLDEQVQAEVYGVRAMPATEEQREEKASGTGDVEASLRDIEGLQTELSKSIDFRTNLLNDAYENVTRYDEVVTRAVGTITSLEAMLLSYRVDLHNPKESLEPARRKQEELQATVADLRNLTETLGAISSPEAKEQLQCTLQTVESENSTLKARLEAQEAEDGRHLSCRCTENDGTCVLGVASALWEKWLGLLEAAREWQQWSGELKREWKFISEEVRPYKEPLRKRAPSFRLVLGTKVSSAGFRSKRLYPIEREAIILEALQEDLPEISKTKDGAPTEELCQLWDSLNQHEESAEKQLLLLSLLLQRVRSIQNIPEGAATVETIPACEEIRSMQERCNRLLQTTQKNKDSVQTEIQARHFFIKEINDVKHLFEQISTSSQDLATEGHPERAERIEELRGVLQRGKLTFESIMEKLRIKYSEMYSIVPSEIEPQVGECRRAMEDAHDKMSSEVSKSSPSCVMRKKIEEINNGLHCLEEMLQQKSKNIEEAQEIQKKIWDGLDHWHSKLNELDSEAQDFADQDPAQAQEWMDDLMAPFQRHQQVSQRAESRTSQLNKATIKMEEYSDLLKSTGAWIEKTSRLLASPICYDSSRTLSHRASTLQMALEDSEQKHGLLHSIFTDLEDLSVIFETDDLIQSVHALSGQVAALQQQVAEALPHVQQVADDVVAIESEVKSMEKKVAKIKAILLSKEIFDFSPEEHLKHGEVILENIHPMKKTIAEILTYQVELRLPQTGSKPLPVFQRTNRLLQDVKLLENVTQEQNELLKGEIGGLEEQILNLNQKKEDLLVGLKAAVLNLHEHLKQEQQEGGEKPSADTLEECAVPERSASERKLNRTSSMSFLPVVKEEAEESSVKSEGASQATVERGRPQPAEVLHACKTRVAELELWLQQANVAFEPETLDTDMQQVVEEELAGCQAMLTEIEHKVASLLETCKDQGLGDCGATQQEAEALSWKLKTVKGNLEKVQMMLQEKYSEDQHFTALKKLSEPLTALQPVSLSELESVTTERPQFSRQKDLPQPQVLELKPLEQKDLIKFTEFNAKKPWLQRCQEDKVANQLSASSSKAPSPGNAAPDTALPRQGQSGDKWQYLHHELASRPNPPVPQLVEPQVATVTSTLPSVSVYNFRGPTADELQTYTAQLEDLRQDAKDIQTRGSMTEETYINLDRRLFELFLSLSRCLGSVEELLQRPGLLREDASAQQVLFEKLALELKKLYLALGDKKDDLLKAVTWPGKDATLLPECLNALEVSLESAQARAAWRSSSLKAGLDHSRSYQNEIKRLYNQLIKKKMALQQSLNEASGQSIGEQLQKADVHTAELQNCERQVTKLRKEGERLRFPHALLQDVYKLEDVLESMWGILRARYFELSSPFLSKSQQGALLQGMAELVSIGREKLAAGPLQHAKSKDALQAQLQDHKGFFQKLVADMLLIQTYSAKMFPPSLQKGEGFGAERAAEVRAVEEEACLHGARLQSVLEKWEEFDENYAALEKDLEVLISSLPSVSLVEETEERLLERISFYQQIKRNTDGKHVRLCQTLNEGKQLAASVSCPELEGQIAKLEEHWLSLNKRIDQELHRLQSLLKHLLSYSSGSAELTRWLESAQQTLNYWKEQSLNASQDLDTIRSSIGRFFEFSKEVDEKSSLKSAVMSTGNQLLHLKEADTAALRASLAQFEQKWTELITQLPDIQEKLHQLQMEKLPSREAIFEMISWMNSVEPQVAGGDAELQQCSASQVKSLLQKLKEFRMEMDYKQWIVDFVNQSLLQLSTCDVESKRYERTEFAEHLGEMNRQWQRVHGTLNRKIQHLEQLLESITENENKIQNLNSWLEAQEERLKMLQKPESAVSMEKLLLDCQVHQLRASVQSALQEWKACEKLYDEANMMTTQLAYSMEHSKPAVLSLEALDCQVQKLQALQDEAESREGSWEKLQEVIGRLKDSCPYVAGIIEEKCQDAHSRWTQVNQDLADQLQEARGQLQLWKAADGAHTEAAARLQQQEARFQQLANINMSGNNLADILPPALQDIKELCHDVLKTKEAFLENSTLLDQLPRPAERSTPGLHSGQLHALQTAAYLEKMLLAKSNEFEIVLAKFKDLGDRLTYLKDLIMHEEENLNKLYQEEKEEVPDSFLNHVLALTAQSPDIERLNEESLRLPLSDITIKTLQNVNRQWIRATATALDHCSKLQGNGLNAKFLHYCEKWSQLLEKIQESLTENVAHDLPALLEQQKTYEMLEAEVSVSQTIADAYVAQSLQLLDTTEIQCRPEFVSEFSKLSERWQSAGRAVQQRKCDIDRLVTQWRFFTTSVEDLLRFLADTGHLLSALKERDHSSPCQTRRLIHELKNKEIHVQRWRTTYELALEAGEKLRDTPNLETKEFIDRQASRLQDTWKDTELSLREMIRQLQSTAETWDQCEKRIKELKSRLQVLNAQSKDPLPELHEDLHKEKELIKEVEASLAHWTHNLKELQAMKADLSQHILAEDVTVLKEQIELLHRQWEDLCLRVAVRKQEIEDRLNSWIVFNEKNKELCAWLVQMENKVLQTADISIEEMIEKLQKDCMEEISLFSENKLQLKQLGDQLIKASSKAKAAETEDKLSKVNDRWQHLFDVIGSRKLSVGFNFSGFLVFHVCPNSTSEATRTVQMCDMRCAHLTQDPQYGLSVD